MSLRLQLCTATILVTTTPRCGASQKLHASNRLANGADATLGLDDAWRTRIDLQLAPQSQDLDIDATIENILVQPGNSIQECGSAREAGARNLTSYPAAHGGDMADAEGEQIRGRQPGYLGMSLEVLLNTYGHHHPDYLSDAVEKIAMREPIGERKAHVSGAVSGAALPLRRNNS